MDKVLVVKAVKPNYNTLSGGPPIMMVGGGGGRGGGGTTMRQRAGGLAGGLVGVAGALAGQHRSLGSLAQSMISGGAQGAALGGGLGRRLVGRRGQALADSRERERQENAQLAAEHEKEFRGTRSSEGRKMGGRIPFFNRMSDKEMANQRRSYLTGVQNKEQQAAQQARINQARQRAQARAEGREFGEENKRFAQDYRDMRENLQGLSEENKNQVFNDLNQAFKNYGNTSRVNPTQGSGMTAVVDAGGNQLAQGSQMNNMSVRQLPPPAGSVGSGNETADRQGQGINDAQGFNFETENEPGDNMKSKTLAGAMQEDEEEDPSQQVLVQGNQQPTQNNQQPSTLVGALRRDQRRQGM